jgi:hypothetical protein
LHEDKEHDTDLRVDDAEEHSEGVECLSVGDTVFGCGAYFVGNFVFHEFCMLRISPTGEEGDPKQK